MRTQIRFPRTMAALGDVLARANHFSEAAGASERTLFAMQLAVEELFTNAVRHGVGGRDYVEVAIALEDGRLSVTVTDYDVEPWDPDDLAPVDTRKPLSERPSGGLGVHILRSLFDRMEWEYEDRAFRITVTKELEPGDVRSTQA